MSYRVLIHSLYGYDYLYGYRVEDDRTCYYSIPIYSSRSYHNSKLRTILSSLLRYTLMRHNREQIMEFVNDPDIYTVIDAPSFVNVDGESVRTMLFLPDNFVENWVNMVCDYYEEEKGIPWQKILFQVHHVKNIMFLDVNSPTVTH